MSSTSSPGRDRTPAMSRPLPPIEPRRVPPAVTPPPASPEAGEKQPDDSPLTPQHHLSSRARAKVEPNLGSPSPSRRFRRLSQIRGSGKSPSTPGLLKRLASITSSKGHRAPEKASEEERQSAREQIDELAKKTTSLIGMADLTHVRRLGEGAFATVDLYAVDPILLEHAIARRVSLDDAEDAAFNASGSLSPELRRAISGDSLRSSNSGSVGTGDATTPQQKPRSSGGKGDAATPHQIALKAMKLKVPAPPHPERPEEVRMVDVPHAWRVNFLSEAILLRALRHENVVACYGCVRDDLDGAGGLRFLMEYCEGGSLLDRLRKPRSYSALEALTWVAHVARGMEYLHGASSLAVAHRDLKPENILLARGVAKVADFGLSRLVDVGGRESAALRESGASSLRLSSCSSEGSLPPASALAVGRQSSEQSSDRWSDGDAGRAGSDAARRAHARALSWDDEAVAKEGRGASSEGVSPPPSRPARNEAASPVMFAPEGHFQISHMAHAAPTSTAAAAGAPPPAASAAARTTPPRSSGRLKGGWGGKRGEFGRVKPEMTGETGSARYMAPEVHRHQQYDQKVDVFSFGVLACEVLSRRRAYAERYMSMEQVAAAVSTSGDFRPALPARWPAPIADLIRRCWAQQPADRPSFSEVRAELDQLLAAAEQASADGTPSEVLDAFTPRRACGCFG